MAKNTICLWYEKDAEAAARFYAETFPDSTVGAVTRAPGDYPSGKQGDVLVVEFTVAGVACIGLNGGSTFKHSEAFSFQIATDDQEETDRYWNAIVGNGGEESQCGWCRDRWGISWQITPRALTEAMAVGGAEAKRAFDAMMDDGQDRRGGNRSGKARLNAHSAIRDAPVNVGGLAAKTPTLPPPDLTAITATMRLRSDIFVSALLRRVFAKGDFAAVEKKGAEQAGAIFIRQHFRDGLETLYAPAPQSLFDEEATGDRLFEVRLLRADPEAVRAMLERERKFDSDLWVVELEAEDVADIVPLG